MTTQELTKQEQEGAVAESEEAYAVETQIKVALADGREALWRLAEALNAFDEMRGWLKLDHDNLGSWLADADVTLTKGTYYRLVRTWRKLVVEHHIDADRVRLLDQSKVAIVVDKIAENKVSVDKAFADVESLGAVDLREKYYGPKPEKPEPATTQQEPSGHKPEDEPAAEPSEDEAEPNVEIDEGEEPAPGDDPDFQPVEEVDGELGTDDESDSTSGEAASAAVEALAAADALPWEELNAAYKSGAAFPRVSREVVTAFLQWQKTHLG